MGAEHLASPGFDPRTFQPELSYYTYYVIPARNFPYSNGIFFKAVTQNIPGSLTGIA
jgi:hypothetical protein